MKFTCDRCDAQYMISDEKVGPNGVKVRCKKCSNVILVRRAAENGAVAREAPAPAAAAPAGGSGEGLDAELGSAFDHAFGDTPAKGTASPKADAPAVDHDSTQAVSPEEATRLAAASAPPEPAATEWYVAIGQAQVGPLPLAEVRRKWESGDVGPDSLVWRPGMGDWSPLTGVKDLSAYLAAVPRGTPRPRVEASAGASLGLGRATAAAAPAPAVSSAGPAADVSWKPLGASALAALASEEIAGQGRSVARPEAKPGAAGMRSLVDALPDGGGVDPTGAIPLPIKALEQKTEEKALPRRSGVARGAEQIRHQRTSRALVLSVVAVAVVAVAGAGAYLFVPRLLAPAPQPIAEAPAAPAAPAPKPEVATAPPPKPAEPAHAEPAPAAEPSPAPAPTATPAAGEPPPPAPQPVAAATPKEEPPAAKAAPPQAKNQAAKEPARPAHEKVRRPEPRETKVAKAEPAAAPEPAKPAKKKGGGVLDFDDSGDAALDEALGGGKSGRSVYVPPPAGGSATPATVSDSQVQEAIMTRVAALQQCLGEQKARDAGASGVLKMRWNIQADGGVQNLKCVTPEFASSPFAQCMTNVLKSVRYPKSQQGRQDVTFPFKF